MIDKQLEKIESRLGQIESRLKRLRKRLAGAFEIVSPSAGSTTPVYTNPEPAKSTVAVSGTFDSVFDEVWIKVYAPDEDIPDEIPDPVAKGCTRANLAGSVFSHKAVKMGANHAKFVVAAFQGPIDGPYEGGAVSANVSALLTNKHVVDAKQCIWFTFAGDDYSGHVDAKPDLESGEVYRPQIVYVPQGATQVTVSATGSWGHCPNCSSYADGNGMAVVDSPHPWYRDNLENNATQINGIDTNFNSLVGMWIFDGNQQATEFKFGTGDTVAIPTQPSRPTHLVLAFHDSWEWSNNEGVVEATVTWA